MRLESIGGHRRPIRIYSADARYDGSPNLESVDLAIVGAWGEGAGADLLTEPTREAVAAGTAAPVGSVTVPATPPGVLWPGNHCGKARIREKISENKTAADARASLNSA